MVDYTGETYWLHMVDDCVIYAPREDHFTITIKEGEWNVFDYRDGSFYERGSKEAGDFFIYHIQICLAINNFYGRMKDFHKSYQDWESLYIGLCYSIGFFCYAFSSFLF